jgi:nucleoid-associated protein YejK
MINYQVNKVALHPVSKSQPQPATDEILLSNFSAPDQQAIQDFFAGHLKHIWGAGEARTTSSAQFNGNSQIKKFYQDLDANPAKFFPHSCDMARLLNQAAKGTNASDGVLMVLWLTVDGDARKFLTLIKMEPARADRIALTSKGKQLLDLAVKHIDAALPEPGDQVLKWAITPHPNRPLYNVKVRDEEGKELAQYFMNFLGCVPRLSEKKQIEKILEILPEYTKRCHPAVKAETVVPAVLDELEQALIITPDVVVNKIRETRQFKNFDEAKFRDELNQAEIGDLAVSANAWRATKLQYKLPSGIVIKGPRSVMENQVVVKDLGDEVEFRIRSPKNYEPSYGS